MVSISARWIQVCFSLSYLMIFWLAFGNANHDIQHRERVAIKSDLNEREIDNLARSYDVKVVKKLMNNYYVMEKRTGEISDVFERLAQNEHVRWLQREEHQPYSKRGFPKIPTVPRVPNFNDPLYKEQWYYQSEGQQGITAGSDHSIIDVWKMGYNGTGVKVVVIDDGFDHTHPDLKPNYNSKYSKDLNENDSDPYPRIPKEDREYNAHGTKCGGQIAGIPNNGICGVGIAHGAQIGGIKILDGSVTDSVEAEAFRHECEEVDIYSMSWGPSDDGMTFGGFMKLSYEAIDYCIKHGRGGLGSIYVWASGNGGAVGDCCSADSLVSSPFTVSIGALTHEGRPAYFQESCPSTLAAVYTGGVSRDQMAGLLEGEKHEKSFPMVTTSIMFNKEDPTASENCDEYFSGTSAAGPLGAGMIALLLQSNPKLGWRDVQHIIVETCDQPNPKDADVSRDGGAWEFNGDGRTVSHDFGFGVMNAAKMILAARNWTIVPKRKQCSVGINANNTWKMMSLEADKALTFTFDGNNCKGKVNFVEHVLVVATYVSSYRGSVQMEIKSPKGYTSILMRPRPKDNSTEELKTWPFVSFLHWGEPTDGKWKVKFAYDESLRPDRIPADKFKAEVKHVELVLYGTKTRHVNPSKSSPNLAKLKKEESLEKEAIQEQFEYDKKTNSLIGETIDKGAVMKRGGDADPANHPFQRRGYEAERGELERNQTVELGVLADFQDPYAAKITKSGYQPRLSRKQLRTSKRHAHGSKSQKRTVK